MQDSSLALGEQKEASHLLNAQAVVYAVYVFIWASVLCLQQLVWRAAERGRDQPGNDIGECQRGNNLCGRAALHQPGTGRESGGGIEPQSVEQHGADHSGEHEYRLIASVRRNLIYGGTITVSNGAALMVSGNPRP